MPRDIPRFTMTQVSPHVLRPHPPSHWTWQAGGETGATARALVSSVLSRGFPSQAARSLLLLTSLLLGTSGVPVCVWGGQSAVVLRTLMSVNLGLRAAISEAGDPN